MCVPIRFRVVDKYRPAYSGGGNVENRTSENGAIPSRWMAYEAMLAGLEMTPFWDGIKVKDLVPNTGKDSMTHFYKVFEYIFPIRWEDHSESRPPLLASEGAPPLQHFSRSAVSFSYVHILSKLGYTEPGIANVPGRYSTTKNCIHLCACTRRERALLHTFLIRGSLKARSDMTGRRSFNCFALK
jgi:hypothetical protein